MASTPAVGRGRRRVAFSAEGEEAVHDIAVVAFLRHSVVCADGVTLTSDFTGLP